MSPKHNIQEVFDDKEKRDRFRVVVFGSARTKPGQPVYEDVFKLGKMIADKGYDIVTGGGPGAMEAANLGHESSTTEDLSDSYGINIKLPFEQFVNGGVEIAHEHERFSTRLDEFMSLANVVVITQGGIGTLLELFYTWQLIQVKHIAHIPIVVVGEMWEGLFEWMKDDVLKRGMFSATDLDVVHIVKDADQAMDVINKWNEQWVQDGGANCAKCKKYEIAETSYKVLFDHNDDHDHDH